MTTLIRTEWMKMRKYNAFWWVMGLTALSYPGINYIFYMIYDSITHNTSRAGELAKMALGNPFSFPEVWHTVAYASSLFVFIPAVMVIMFITNEYSFKTHRQNIIDGWSRKQFVWSKLLDVLLITVLITVLYMLIAFMAGQLSHDRLLKDTWGQFWYSGLFALQTFSQLSLAFLAGFLVRKAFMALGVFLFYYLVLEPVAVGLLRLYGNDAGRFLPLEISDRLIPIPAFLAKLDEAGYNKALAAIPFHIACTTALTLAVWVFCFRINQKRDLN